MRLYLGNAAVLQPKPANDDGTQDPPDRRSDLDGNPTMIDTADGTPLLDVLRNTANLWELHSTSPPTWVSAENPTIAEALSAQFGGAPIRPYEDAQGHYHEAAGIIQPQESAPAPEDAQVGLPAAPQDINQPTPEPVATNPAPNMADPAQEG